MAAVFRLDAASASECLACRKKFSLLSRKLNCSECGFVFCSSCIAKPNAGSDKDRRVCVLCSQRGEGSELVQCSFMWQRLRLGDSCWRTWGGWR